MKRQRPIRSCLSCRKRRLRCDQLHPSCSRCSSANTLCAYDNGAIDAPANNATSTVLPSQRTSQLHAQVDVLAGDMPRSPDVADKERGQVFLQNGGRSSYVGPTFWGNAIPPEYHRSSRDPAGFPSVRATNPFPRWYIPYDDVLRWQSQQPEISRRPDELRMPKLDPVQCKFCGHRYKLGCILSLLPSKENCERLCELFFSTVFPLLPILHIGTFATDFQTFWRERSAGMGHDADPGLLVRRKPGFICLLCAILHAALKCSPKPRLHDTLGGSFDLTAGDLYVLAVVSTNLSGFPRRPSHYSLAAYILSQNPFVMEEDFPDFPDFINTAFRVSLSMGLHRKLHNVGFNDSELEIRRRLWWYVLHLDVMSSASSGLSPLFIDSRMANVEMISQSDQFGEHEAGMIDVRYLVATNRYSISDKMREILRLHFEDALQSATQVNEVSEQLRLVAQHVGETVQMLLTQPKLSDTSRLTRSPESLHGTPQQESDSFGHAWTLGSCDQKVLDFCSWSAILLHLMVHKAFCALYHGLFRDAGLMKNPQIRISAVVHAQAFLQLFIRLCNDPVSEPFHWIYPGIYQPLQAMSLLIADLLKFPHSAEAVLSRGLVDAVFSQYQIDEGLVGTPVPPERQLSATGRDAWNMLAEARRKVLDLVGEDHHVLLPSRCPYSDICICGERFAESQHPEPCNRNEPTESFDLQTGQFGPVELEDIPPLPPINEDFDWHEWDATVGDLTGFMS